MVIVIGAIIGTDSFFPFLFDESIYKVFRIFGKWQVYFHKATGSLNGLSKQLQKWKRCTFFGVKAVKVSFYFLAPFQLHLPKYLILLTTK